jgi:hypothetical protein
VLCLLRARRERRHSRCSAKSLDEIASSHCLMLSPEELKTVDNFRFHHRMPSRAAAVRELLRHGLAAVGEVIENIGVKSRDYSVLKSPKGLRARNT